VVGLRRIPIGKRVSTIDILMFTRNFRVMINAGLSITRILEILANQAQSRKFRQVINDINEKLRRGVSLAEAFSGYPQIFDELYISMLRTGESGSNLEGVLAALEEQLRRDYELRSKIKSAMIYPAVILSALFGVGSLIIFFVMPRLAKAFAGLGTKLPFTLKIFLGLNELLIRHWPVLILAAAIFVFFLRFLLRFRGFKTIKGRLILILPVFGNISRQLNAARFLRTFSSLIVGGVPIYHALEITANTLNNPLFSRSLKETALEVQRGKPLAQSFRRALWPPIVAEMVAIGEETGKLADMLRRLALFYEEEVANTVKNLSSLIEPILMIVIGIAIGIFAISVIQPIYSIVGSF
jgi:type IV pilus assembly protein PilC